VARSFASWDLPEGVTATAVGRPLAHETCTLDPWTSIPDDPHTALEGLIGIVEHAPITAAVAGCERNTILADAGQTPAVGETYAWTTGYQPWTYIRCSLGDDLFCPDEVEHAGTFIVRMGVGGIGEDPIVAGALLSGDEVSD